MEQYNLALVRRGLPINHPVPEHDEPDPHGGQVHSDSDSSHPWSGGEEADEELARAYIEDFDEGAFEADTQGDTHTSGGALSVSTMSSNRMDVDPPGTSSGKRANDAGAERDSNTGPTGKKRKLPGTGGDQNAKAAMEGGPRPVALPHPTTTIHSYVRWYRKVHRVFSYGIAYKILSKQMDAGANAYTLQVLTTPLMEIPWDRRFFYLNPSEFALLPDGSSFNKCRVQVLQRNVRVAFPTNSTDNNLATLNQNKNVIVAIGLYHKLNAIGIQYAAFQDNQPMIPSDFNLGGRTVYDNLIRDMYGPPDNDNNFTAIVPRHQCGIPQLFPVYAALANARPQGAAAVVAGWENLQKHYQEVDADASTGNCIVDMEYHPNVGICKKPQEIIYRGPAIRQASKDIVIPRGSHTLVPHETRLVFTNLNDTRPETIEDNTPALRNTVDYTLNGWIEQSQFVYQGIYKHESPCVQQAIHVGVQPTPALTTKALINDQTNNAFTDTQAYFEIIAECEINTSYPTFRPLATFTNVKEGDQWKESTRTRFAGLGLYDGLVTGR